MASRWEGNGSDRFKEVFETFLASLQSIHTRRSYSRSLIDFWCWCDSTLGGFPRPDKVRRADAEAYAAWLRDGTGDLAEMRLRAAGRMFDLSVLRILREGSGANEKQIREHLHRKGFTKHLGGATVLEIESSSTDERALFRRLAELTIEGVVRRAPTMVELRERFARAGLDKVVDGKQFRYHAAGARRVKGHGRASTISVRLNALSSLWQFLCDTGENTGEGALLQHNIWKAPLRRASRSVASQKKASRKMLTPSLALVEAVLATTYAHSHASHLQGKAAESAAAEAARLALAGESPSRSSVAATPLGDGRDRALVLVMFWTGARANEVTRLKFSDLAIVDGRSVVRIRGKGGKHRVIALPEVAREAVVALRESIRAAAANRKRGTLAQLRDAPDPPLVPVLKMWGKNAGKPPSGLGRRGMAKAMRRRAALAGLKGDDLRRIHPHGLRHLAGQSARKRGRSLVEIQSALGHSSLSTTGQYVEHRDGVPSLAASD